MKRITIGRSSDNNLVINNNMVSRYHCEIIQESNRIKIVDLNSSNGTFVNGKRVYGATFLNYSDNVCVHNIPIGWQNYFVNSQTFNPSKKTSNVLPIILGVLGGVLVLIATVYLLVSYSDTNNNQSVFAEEIRIGMTLNDINNINNTNVVLQYSPKFESELYDINSFNYYLVNNTTAVIIKNNQVSEFCTWDSHYYTSNGLSIHSTLGDVLEQYSTNMECWYDVTSYNYISMRYESLFYLYDKNSCTSFVFLASQFTSQQQAAIIKTGSLRNDVGGRVYLSKLSYSMLQSISSAVSVSWIAKYNCSQPKQSTYQTSGTYQSTPKKVSSTPTLRQESFYIKLRDSETFTLSDGTKINTSLSNMGLGDVTLKISWYGKTPTKLSWRLDGSGLSPTSNVIYAKKNGDTYSLSEWVYFDWTSDNPTVRGVSFTIYPISEADRKYER